MLLRVYVQFIHVTSREEVKILLKSLRILETNTDLMVINSTILLWNDEAFLRNVVVNNSVLEVDINIQHS